MNRDDALAASKSLLRSGLTVRDVAELFRAHPAAVAALLSWKRPEKPPVPDNNKKY